jgi:CHAT domain
MTGIALAFDRPADADRLLQAIRFPRERRPNFEQDMALAWNDVFSDLENGVLPPTPYRTILLAALRVFADQRLLRPLAVRYGLVEASQPQVVPELLPETPGRPGAAPAEAPPATCHVIIRAGTEEERQHAEQRLRELRLEPREVWSTGTAISYRISSDDRSAVRRALAGTDLGWTVVAVGELDYLLQNVYVEGPDLRRFRVRDAPAQQTISNLATEILTDQYPRPGDATVPITVDHVSDSGETQRVDADSTLHDTGVRDGDTLRVGYQTNAGAGLSEQDLWETVAAKVVHAPEGAGLSSTRDDQDRLRIRAEMDPEMGLDKTSIVRVMVSWESSLGSALTRSEAIASFSVANDDPLIIEAVPRANLHVVGPDRFTIPVPRPLRPQVVHFEARATDVGSGELWVVARQGQVALKTLVLISTIIAATATDEAVMTLPREPAAPIQTLRVIEQRYGNTVRYRYDIDAPALGLLGEFESELIQGDRDAYVRSLFARIEGFWIDTNGDQVRFGEELRSFGGELLDQLVPVELQRILWERRHELTEVMVMSTEPFIPWELIHLKDPNQRTLPDETCFLGELGLVRWDWGTPPPQHLRVRAGRAHLIAPDYPQPHRLKESASESGHLRKRLGAQDVEPHHHAVLALLRAGEFDLLHFVGHGAAASQSIADAQLLLQGTSVDERYFLEPLRVSVVEQNFRCSGAPLVFLNACQAGRLGHQLVSIGGFAKAFLGGGAGAFVSSLWSVGDAPAKEFAVAFYDALLDEHTMSAAAKAGRQAARSAGDATWLAYAVYAHPGARLLYEPASAVSPPR